MPRDLYVHLLPSLVEPLALRGGSVVAIDVLRATTTIAHALHAGAEAVVPCESVDAALAMRATLRAAGTEPLLGGERGGTRIAGFDLDNSPRAYGAATVDGRTIVFTTTNGTRALARCREADRIAAGAFANLDAVVDWLAADDRPVHLVCAGTDGEVAVEDCFCAGAIAAGLLRTSAADWRPNDAAGLCLDFHGVHGQNRQAIANVLRRGRGGRNLMELGYDADIERSAETNRCPVVPVFSPRSGRIEIAR